MIKCLYLPILFTLVLLSSTFTKWAFVHVSTAYSQCVRNTVEENVPKIGISYKEVCEFVNARNDTELQKDFTKIMQGWPNTYTFTKAVCEDMLQEEGGGLPICIIRPCVVLATYREPVRGWTDNLYGPVGLLVGVGHGVMHCFKMRLDLPMDFMPVDYTVNCMIAASWSLVTHRCCDDPLPVYNLTSSPSTNFFWKSTVENAMSYKDISPFNNAIYYTSFFTTTNEYLFLFCFYAFHIIPCIFIDKIAELAGNPFRLSRIYDRIMSLRDAAEYFSFRNVWHFEQDNVWRLWDLLGEEDKRIFHFDVRDIDHREQVYLSKIGLKHYYFKENLKDMGAAQRKNTWLYWIHMTVKGVGYLLALKLLVVTARVLPF